MPAVGMARTLMMGHMGGGYFDETETADDPLCVLEASIGDPRPRYLYLSSIERHSR